MDPTIIGVVDLEELEAGEELFVLLRVVRARGGRRGRGMGVDGGRALVPRVEPEAPERRQTELAELGVLHGREWQRSKQLTLGLMFRNGRSTVSTGLTADGVMRPHLEPA